MRSADAQSRKGRKFRATRPDRERGISRKQQHRPPQPITITMDFETAYQAFRIQVINAQKKRVPFDINFRQWCDIWASHIHARGKLQLQRIDKTAGYVMGNLRIGERSTKQSLR